MENSIEWGVVSAADVGAFHRRERIWILANSRCGRFGGSESREVEQPRRAETIGGSVDLADADRMRELQQAGRECDQRNGFGVSSEDVANRNSNSIQRLVAESQSGKHGRPAGLQRGAREFPAWPADPADAPESRLGRVVDGMPIGHTALKPLETARLAEWQQQHSPCFTVDKQ